jgi:hypothetical protein
MMSPVSIDRYRDQYLMLMDLAVFLRDGRADRYAEMVAKGHLTENDAFRDRLARAAIAADWIAIGTHTARAVEPLCRSSWILWALEQSLDVQQRRLDGMDRRDPAHEDHVDLRDAIACLLDHYRSGWTATLLAFNSLRPHLAAGAKVA